MITSTPNILWICSWFPNEEDKFRGDFIERQADALAELANFELAHFVEYASTNKVDSYEKGNGSRVTIGYSKTRLKILSFRAQWKFYNRILKDYTDRNGKPELVHLHIPWKAGFVARYWLKKYKIPYVISEHYGIYNRITQDNFFVKSKVVQKYYHKIFESARRVITVSKSLGEEIKSIFHKEYIAIPNVVNTSNFYFKNITVVSEFTFLHISNMYGIKNTDKIIKSFAVAYAKDASLRLNLVGAQPEELLNQIDKLDCKQAIKVQGEVSYEAVGEIMKAHHAFVLFSDWETQSCVTLEALCSGRPVITSAVGGVQELINVQNGIKVPARDEEALSQAMLDMKENYHQYHLEQIAKDAQDIYSYDKIATQLIEVYKDVLAP